MSHTTRGEPDIKQGHVEPALPSWLASFGSSVVEGMDEGLVALDRDGKILYVNPRGMEIGNWPPGHPVGRSLWDLFPHLVNSMVDRAFKRAMDRNIEVRFEFLGGNEQWMAIRAVPAGSGLAVFFTDVTRQKETDESDAAAEVGFQHLANSMPQIVWSALPGGEIEFLNRRWYEYTGQAAGTPAESRRFVHPRDLARIRHAWEVSSNEKKPFEAEMRLLDKSGEYRWHLTRCVPVLGSDGEVVRWYGTSTEIDEIKQLQEQLRESDRRFRVALAGAHVVAYEQDQDLRYTWLYPASASLTARIIGRTDTELHPGAESEALVALKREVMETGKPVRSTISMTLEGEPREYDLVVEPLRNEAGKTVGVTGACLDITERVRAEKELKASEQRFRHTIENSPIPKIIHAEDGEILYASRAWIAATGFELSETPTVRRWVEKVGTGDSRLLDPFRKAFREHQDDTGEHQLTTKAGGKRIWLLTSAPLGLLPDGRRIAVTAGVDVTARKAIEQGQAFLAKAGHMLARSLKYEETLSTVAHLAVPGLADWCAVDVLEPEGLKRVAVAHVDPEMVSFAREIQEKYPTDLEAPTGVARVLRTGSSELIPEVTQEMLDAANLDEELRDIVAKAQIASVLTVPLVARGATLGAITLVSSKPGRFQSSDVPIFEELGRIGGLAVENARLFGAAEREVEDRRRAEDEVRRLNESLNERVIERTRELKDANDEMQGFTYTVSHDLRAPLRAIVATSMILLDEAGPSLDASGRDMLKRQAAAAKKLSVLIDELLKLSRVSRQQMVRQSIDLATIARDVAAELKLDGRTDRIEFRIQPDLVAFGDPTLLRFVMLNLIENACKFSPEGGVVTVGREGEAFFVRDQGIGFEMAYADKVFLPFERLVGESLFPGTGIGLANVKRIILRHDGRVWAESEPGKGATFYFTIPSEEDIDPANAS